MDGPELNKPGDGGESRSLDAARRLTDELEAQRRSGETATSPVTRPVEPPGGQDFFTGPMPRSTPGEGSGEDQGYEGLEEWGARVAAMREARLRGEEANPIDESGDSPKASRPGRTRRMINAVRRKPEWPPRPPGGDNLQAIVDAQVRDEIERDVLGGKSRRKGAAEAWDYYLDPNGEPPKPSRAERKEQSEQEKDDDAEQKRKEKWQKLGWGPDVTDEQRAELEHGIETRAAAEKELVAKGTPLERWQRQRAAAKAEKRAAKEKEHQEANDKIYGPLRRVLTPTPEEKAEDSRNSERAAAEPLAYQEHAQFEREASEKQAKSKREAQEQFELSKDAEIINSMLKHSKPGETSSINRYSPEAIEHIVENLVAKGIISEVSEAAFDKLNGHGLKNTIGRRVDLEVYQVKVSDPDATDGRLKYYDSAIVVRYDEQVKKGGKRGGGWLPSQTEMVPKSIAVMTTAKHENQKVPAFVEHEGKMVPSNGLIETIEKSGLEGRSVPGTGKEKETWGVSPPDFDVQYGNKGESLDVITARLQEQVAAEPSRVAEAAAWEGLESRRNAELDRERKDQEALDRRLAEQARPTRPSPPATEPKLQYSDVKDNDAAIRAANAQHAADREGGKKTLIEEVLPQKKAEKAARLAAAAEAAAAKAEQPASAGVEPQPAATGDTAPAGGAEGDNSGPEPNGPESIDTSSAELEEVVRLVGGGFALPVDSEQLNTTQVNRMLGKAETPEQLRAIVQNIWQRGYQLHRLNVYGTTAEKDAKRERIDKQTDDLTALVHQQSAELGVQSRAAEREKQKLAVAGPDSGGGSSNPTDVLDDIADARVGGPPTIEAAPPDEPEVAQPEAGQKQRGIRDRNTYRRKRPIDEIGRRAALNDGPGRERIRRGATRPADSTSPEGLPSDPARLGDITDAEIVNTRPSGPRAIEATPKPEPAVPRPSLLEAFALRKIKDDATYEAARDKLRDQALAAGYVLPDEPARLHVRSSEGDYHDASSAFIHELMEGRQGLIDRRAEKAKAAVKTKVAASGGDTVDSQPQAETDATRDQVLGRIDTLMNDRIASLKQSEEIIGNVEALAARDDDAATKESDLAYLQKEAVDKNVVLDDPGGPLGVRSNGTADSDAFLERYGKAVARMNQGKAAPPQAQTNPAPGKEVVLARRGARDESAYEVVDAEVLPPDPARIGTGEITEAEIVNTRPGGPRAIEAAPKPEAPPEADKLSSQQSETAETPAVEETYSRAEKNILARLQNARTRKALYRIAEKAAADGVFKKNEGSSGRKKPQDTVAPNESLHSQRIYDLLREQDADIASYEAIQRYMSERIPEPETELARVKDAYTPEKAHAAEFAWTPDAVEAIEATRLSPAMQANLRRQLISSGHIEASDAREGDASSIEYAGNMVHLEPADEVGAKALGVPWNPEPEIPASTQVAETEEAPEPAADDSSGLESAEIVPEVEPAAGRPEMTDRERETLTGEIAAEVQRIYFESGDLSDKQYEKLRDEQFERAIAAGIDPEQIVAELNNAIKAKELESKIAESTAGNNPPSSGRGDRDRRKRKK